MFKLKHFVEIMALSSYFIINFQHVNSVCNVYPKIFGKETGDINLNDMEIHEGTDTIVSGGSLTDLTLSYPILIVSSLSTTKVKWAVTDYSLQD